MASGIGPGAGGERTGVWVIPVLTPTPRQIRGDAVGAVPSPDGNQILFLSTKTIPEIWAMSVSGENARRLHAAEPGQSIGRLQWSPDGNRFAYMTWAMGPQGELQVSIESRDANGADPAVLVSDRRLRNFMWTSDGRILFSRLEDPSNLSEMNLWSLELNSSGTGARGEPRRVTDWPGFQVGDLSVTAAGTMLVFIRESSQADVYLTSLQSTAAEPRRITFDERLDWPTSWSADQQQILFHSNRNGNWDVFRQKLDGPSAEQVVLGPGDQLEAVSTPDGNWILYWSAAAGANSTTASRSLMKIPATGGPPEPLLEAGRDARLRCGSGSRSGCVISESSGRDVVFTAVDAAHGRGQELFRLPGAAREPGFVPNDSVSGRGPDPPRLLGTGGGPEWDISPDGRELAVLIRESGQLNVLVHKIGGGTERIPASGLGAITGFAWAADGARFLLTAKTAVGSRLLSLDRQGKVSELWKVSGGLSHPLPAGNRLAVAVSTNTSNAWILENF